jgi:hypothetical protein
MKVLMDTGPWVALIGRIHLVRWVLPKYREKSGEFDDFKIFVPLELKQMFVA